MNSDNRMTPDLILEILDTLERHGYHRRDHRHTGLALVAIHDLAGVYEGTRDVPGTYVDRVPLMPHPEPRSTRAHADPNDVTLTVAEAITAVTALNIAIDHKRHRSQTCADCANQSCSSCQARLQAARTYDLLAEHLLRNAEAAKDATGSQPPAADKEAGQ